ncbi:U-box domain-containing protein 15 isoform X2 [Apium graveolens]|uniref:U-box domain-containing protein 15 isoform X2 n=1 Tax=Apium graveolens TaxID=4045 RepID=UPI003D7A15C7
MVAANYACPNNNNNIMMDQHRDQSHVINELIGVIAYVKAIADFRITQKTPSCCLIRRLKLLIPLLQEIRDLDSPLPDECFICLRKFHKAFHSARKLLKACSVGSKIYLAFESEGVMIRFKSVYQKICQALDGLPQDKLALSEQVKKQVKLIREQLRRAKTRSDSQDMELAMDMMVVLSTENDRNADSASIDRLANKLGLRTVEDLNTETAAVRKLVKERRGHNAEATKQTLDILRKFRRFAGMDDKNIFEEPVAPKALNKSPSIATPHEFLCPISLEIMTDPVIISTGQTYERYSIQQWLDSGHRTCPKSGQPLDHLTLAPNFALKNLILQWCEKYNIELPKNDAARPPTSPEKASTEPENRMLTLLTNLSSSQLDVQRKSVIKIRKLSKESPESRVLIAKNGGIPPLVQLLSYPDSKIQENAVTALLNLSIDEENKILISKEEPIAPIIEILQNGTIGAKENSAVALFSLSMLDENKSTIGALDGIPPLIELLRTGTIRGIMAPLLQILKDNHLDMIDETLSILLLLSSHPEGRQEIGQLSFVETLVNFIRDGTPKNKECASAVLLELGVHNSNLLLAALQYGVYEHLVEVAKSGTDRAQRKANSILQQISNSEQI